MGERHRPTSPHHRRRCHQMEKVKKQNVVMCSTATIAHRVLCHREATRIELARNPFWKWKRIELLEICSILMSFTNKEMLKRTRTRTLEYVVCGDFDRRSSWNSI